MNKLLLVSCVMLVSMSVADARIIRSTGKAPVSTNTAQTSPLSPANRLNRKMEAQFNEMAKKVSQTKSTTKNDRDDSRRNDRQTEEINRNLSRASEAQRQRMNDINRLFR